MTELGLILSPNSHNPTKISKIVWTPRKWCLPAQAGPPPPMWGSHGVHACHGRLCPSRVSPARYNMEFLSVSGGRTQKYKVRAGETLTGVCGSFYDPDGGVFIALHGGFPPLHIKLRSNMRNASRHEVVWETTPSFRHAEQGGMKKW